MKTKIRNLSALISALIVAGVAPVYSQGLQVTAENPIAEENAEERINFSGKLRMLSQRIPSAACHLERDIETAAARALLEGATAEFEQILFALEFGDKALNILEPETRRKSIARMHQLRDIWVPFKAAADAVIAGTATDADVNYLLTQNQAVLGAAQLLVEELVKQYTNPNTTTRAALMLIDISGRQRMLTQKMSKESCILGTAHETVDTVSDLEETAQIFEASLDALRFGMPAVGVGPPPNLEIAAGLDGVFQDWMSVQPLITQVASEGDLAPEEHAIKFAALNTTMANMNIVVGMYAGAAKPNS